jgi:diguanylate cyclase (GGDEF)-like protein
MTADVEQYRHLDRDGCVSGLVINVLIGLVRGSSGELGVAQALALSNEGRTFSSLGDVTSWSTEREAVSMFNAAALVIGDRTIGLHVGEALLGSFDPGGFVGRLSALGEPGEVMLRIGAVLGHFEIGSEATALEVTGDHALVRVKTVDGRPRHAHLCEMTRGMLTQVPTLFSRAPALITETECGARGGRYCLYAVSWDDPSSAPTFGPTHDTRAADGEGSSEHPESDADEIPELETIIRGDDARLDELRAELDKMTVLMEGAFATALELLGDDIESLLAQIASRADSVVTGHRYLLMVRVREGSPIQLHHRGLEPDEAQALAAELWREESDLADDSWLVVDIASSRRRYGYLAEAVPTGRSYPPSELRLLQLYAEYAATAIDVFSELTDAKRSDATARTLLSFSQELSSVTALPDLVQLLVATVPRVTQCDQATVHLWESEIGELIPRARSDSSERPPAPVVPLRSPAAATRASRAAPDSDDPRHGDAPRPVAPDSSDLPMADGDGENLSLRRDSPLIERFMGDRDVLVIDEATEDPVLARLLKRSGATTSVVAPLFAAGEFLGIISADFSDESPTAMRDPDLHERLSGLADQAATALQNLSLLEKVSHLAWHDVLTGLPNRRLFEDRVEQELVRSRRVGETVCMFFVDLDHFKSVNDSLGHGGGDELLRQVSQRLVDTVRQQDTVARVGGDEFAILLPGLSEQVAVDQLAQRSLEALSTPFIVFGEEVRTSVSIGITVAPEHGDSYDQLLSRADEAMYRAKGRGRNAFQMYSPVAPEPSMGQHPVDERSLYFELLDGLEHEEFFVLYQPYIDLRTSEVVGVEALVRWNHPRLGILEPSSFISLAERSDIIVAIDAFVLAETCRQARRWLDRGLPPLRLSVNLASRDLANPDLFATIDAVLEETRIAPNLLELEITERVVLDKSGPAKENIERLRRLGVRFTIDDFGTGQSSLSRIGAFPVSTLKIDQSFVQVLGPDNDKTSLVSAIISMADRLGLECVAEGVETSVQSRVLLQRGCTTAQGYYFSPPLAPEEIEAMLDEIGESPLGPITGTEWPDD